MNTELLKKHLAIAKRIIEDTKMLTTEYNGCTPQQILKIFPVTIEYGIPVEEMSVDVYGRICLKRCYSHFEFNIVHNYRLTNKTTHNTLDDNKYYIHFGCGGCGRLCLSDSRYAYTEEAENVWVNFLKRIQKYDPIDWDSRNKEYIFSVENGYRLYKDFENIYKTAEKDMRCAIAIHKKAKLEAEIERLNKEETLS